MPLKSVVVLMLSIAALGAATWMALAGARGGDIYMQGADRPLIPEDRILTTSRRVA